MDMTLPWMWISIASIVSWIFGAIWFGPVFGKTWMKIHHEKTLSDAEMKDASKGMFMLLIWEFIATFFMMMTLAFLISILPGLSGIHIAFMVWIGFVLPMTISNVLWGADKKKWMALKVALAAGSRLITFLVAGYIFSGF